MNNDKIVTALTGIAIVCLVLVGINGVDKELMSPVSIVVAGLIGFLKSA